MNVKAMNETRRIVLHNYSKEITGDQYRVFSLLLEMTDETNSCFPSEEYLARELNIGVATVKRSIKKLSELGLITVKKSMFFIDNHPSCKNTYVLSDLTNYASLQNETYYDTSYIKLLDQNDTSSEERLTKDNWFIGLEDKLSFEDKYLSKASKEEVEQIKAYQCKQYSLTQSTKAIDWINACNRRLINLFANSLLTYDNDRLLVDYDDTYLSFSENSSCDNVI